MKKFLALLVAFVIVGATFFAPVPALGDYQPFTVSSIEINEGKVSFVVDFGNVSEAVEEECRRLMSWSIGFYFQALLSIDGGSNQVYRLGTYDYATLLDMTQTKNLQKWEIEPTSAIQGQKLQIRLMINSGDWTIGTQAVTIEIASSTTESTFDKLTDVPTNSWFYDDVKYAIDNGLFNGVSDSEFAPNATMTRAMFITVLARYAKVDTAGGETWYSKAVEWGKSNNITDGSVLDDAISREQLVALLWRYIGQPSASNELTFSDSGTTSSWATTAMKWAVANGIVSGKGNNLVAPLDGATRAEVAAIFHRFVGVANGNVAVTPNPTITPLPTSNATQTASPIPIATNNGDEDNTTATPKPSATATLKPTSKTDDTEQQKILKLALLGGSDTPDAYVPLQPENDFKGLCLGNMEIIDSDGNYRYTFYGFVYEFSNYVEWSEE